jgi:hypothetical protein
MNVVAKSLTMADALVYYTDVAFSEFYISFNQDKIFNCIRSYAVKFKSGESGKERLKIIGKLYFFDSCRDF